MEFKENILFDNRYRLTKEIGRGAFGEVWLAHDEQLDFDVAIKIYVALDSHGLDEFKNEFKNVRHISHPNLLRPDHYDEYEKHPYLVMTYCPNSVGRKIGILNEVEVWQFIKDVSAGLAYLHDMDIVHRDIKPDNILQNSQGVYVISDFGLSQKMRSTLRRASGRYVKGQNPLSGTIGYMAPEMFTANPNAVKATDIWALGATIYEIITGDMPFCGQGGVMELHGAECPELPSNFGATLSHLMQRCLSKDAWDRPTAKEINKIAHQVCPDLGEEHTASESFKEKDKYLKEIELLNAKISSLKQIQSSNTQNTGNRKYVICTVVLLLFILFGGMYGILTLSNYNAKIVSLNSDLHDALTIIEEINDICENGVDSVEDIHGSWTSSNHSHNSVDTKTLHITAYKDDILTFDYDVDSESYDHFVTKVISKQDTTTIKDISGSKKVGNVRYKFSNQGEKTIIMEYRKDHSINDGRDDAKITNIRVERSIVGVIIRKIQEYKND